MKTSLEHSGKTNNFLRFRLIHNIGSSIWQKIFYLILNTLKLHYFACVLRVFRSLLLSHNIDSVRKARDILNDFQNNTTTKSFETCRVLALSF